MALQLIAVKLSPEVGGREAQQRVLFQDQPGSYTLQVTTYDRHAGRPHTTSAANLDRRGVTDIITSWLDKAEREENGFTLSYADRLGLKGLGFTQDDVKG